MGIEHYIIVPKWKVKFAIGRQGIDHIDQEYFENSLKHIEIIRRQMYDACMEDEDLSFSDMIDLIELGKIFTFYPGYNKVNHLIYWLNYIEINYHIKDEYTLDDEEEIYKELSQ